MTHPMTTSAEPAVYRLSGYMGIRSDKLRPDVQLDLQERLSLKGKAWRDFPPTEVSAYFVKDNHFWLPRFYFDGAINRGLVGKYPIKFEWTDGAQINLPNLVTLDPKRGQPAAVDAMEKYLRANSGGILVAPTGTGKCLGKGTPVIMADGRVVPVEQITAGDRLMGPDGTARNVLSTTQQRGQLYRINPEKGESWVCNDVHVLSLVNIKTNEVLDIGLDEWVKKGPTFKRLHKLFSVGIDQFENTPSEVTIDPYFLGVWFGDGVKLMRSVAGQLCLSKVAISKPDQEIKSLCEETAKQWGLVVREELVEGKCPNYFLTHGLAQRNSSNPLLDALRGLVGDDCVIPDCVIRGSHDTRLQFLAGFLDADGDLSCNRFNITQKREDWARSIWWVARSLGFCAIITPRYKRDQHGNGGTYYQVSISGDTDRIPTRIPRKQATPRKQIKFATRIGFSVESIGEGDFFGFMLDGDGRFLLGDFTVTHNTILGYSIGQRLQRAMGVLVYNSHMLDNWIKTAHQVFGLKPEEVGVVQSDQCDLGKPVTIMMIQSLLARDYPKELYEQIGLLITDESPRFAAPSWNEVMRLFPARYRLSLSADPKRDDGLDRLIEWHLGKVGHRITAITAKPAVVQVLYKVNYDKRKFCDWNSPEPNPVKYDKLLQGDKGRNATIVEELVKMRTAGRRILVFSRFKEHLNILKNAFESVWQSSVLDVATDKANEQRAPTLTTMLIGGLKDAKLQAAMEGDVIFTTYAFARDALNLPTIDTLVFATPTGKPLQPIGRLRDKGDPTRRPLMALDFYELPDYSRNKARRRVETYDALGLKTSQIERNAKVVK